MAIQIDNKGNLQKLAATAFSSLLKNGKEILHLSGEADVFFNTENGTIEATVADPSKSMKLLQND